MFTKSRVQFILPSLILIQNGMLPGIHQRRHIFGLFRRPAVKSFKLRQERQKDSREPKQSVSADDSREAEEQALIYKVLYMMVWIYNFRDCLKRVIRKQ